MTAFNNEIHQHLFEKVVAGTMTRYGELSTIPGNPAGSEKVKRLMVVEKGLNLSTQAIPMTHGLFGQLAEMEVHEWIEQILNEEPSVIFFSIESGWMLFNTEGDLMGFIWFEKGGDQFDPAFGAIYTMVADYHEDFADAVTAKLAAVQ